MTNAARQQEILLALDDIEARHDVRILHAIESGSRAWGFPSMDSDYDVRIIYAHPRDWYLSVHEGRDVIEQPMTGDLDIAGWDLRKTLRLLAAGNPVVHEWLGSPIIYRQQTEATAELQALARDAFDARAAYHHYLAMAGKKLATSSDEPMTAKRFLYGLRSILAVRWIVERRSAPPMRFAELVQTFVPEDSAERQDIEDLISIKAMGHEVDTDINLDRLLPWSGDLLWQMHTVEAPATTRMERGQFDGVFRNLLANP